MEHEEIVLDQKRDPRNKGTRYGVKARGTIKYNKYQDYKERNFTGELQMVSPINSVTVSLKKRKNWEVSQQSFDDSDVNTRVVIVDRNEAISMNQLEYKLLKMATAAKKVVEEEKPELISGTNRKGFFARGRRRPGKERCKRNANSLSDG
eukprot:TRINITY_DN8968_c0_g1_i1.p1 TRINITY_DN8968_c0_g1~~TRINITY_DN8968_c0_g1_i1.p1  ORF type:complete len:150 (+),score=15.92 TRINITY_DN8968_c0_g1_i1:34-483(+)